MLMKRFFAVMTVFAVLMLVVGLAACDGDGDGNSGGGGGGGNIPPNANRGWPSSSILAQYGLSGLPQVSGASNIYWDTEIDDGVEVIGIVFQVSSDPTSFYRTWFTNNGYQELGSSGNTNVFYNFQTGAMGSVHYEQSEGWAAIGGGIER